MWGAFAKGGVQTQRWGANAKNMPPKRKEKWWGANANASGVKTQRNLSYGSYLTVERFFKLYRGIIPF